MQDLIQETMEKRVKKYNHHPCYRDAFSSNIVFSLMVDQITYESIRNDDLLMNTTIKIRFLVLENNAIKIFCVSRIFFSKF